jgi:DNA polymerase I
MADLSITGAILDVDYLLENDTAAIRLFVKGTDGKAYEVFDRKFRPYFYFVPSKPMTETEVMNTVARDGTGLRPESVENKRKSIFGKETDGYLVFAKSPLSIPRLSAVFLNYGQCYEFDIPFAKRYVIDTGLFPFLAYEFRISKENDRLSLESFERCNAEVLEPNLLCFDIEVYNPLGVPRASVDPVIMISYAYSANGKNGGGVVTYKKVDLPFVEVVADEKALFKRFMMIVKDLEIDIISGYNSANFDVRYMLERAEKLRIEFDLSRFRGGTRIEKHGLYDRVKLGGRVHIDVYLVVKFVAVVGAAEYILKMNSYTLKNVYEAVSKDKKITVEKRDIYKLWDGTEKELKELAVYNMNDSEALMEVYGKFVPIMVELSKTTGDVPSDVAVSTAGQLVEFTLMRYAYKQQEVIPNRPDEYAIKTRMDNPIEGAYVKTPEPGIYENLALFDFRGLYPSIIVSHNIDPSSLCEDCKDFYESPTGAKFDKNRKAIVPMILRMLMEQRTEVKKLYKKDPSNISYGSRSQALKIVANSFYGYLGYARSRWYSRQCAASVTAYGRQYIHETIDASEKSGFKVVYGDTDSIVLLIGNNTKDAALKFVKDFNSKLPESMELELEDFYTRGVFVGKKTERESAGAKKKYALISESGRVKIRGFELVRRDWSKVARDTQRAVLDAILKEGSREKAAQIVRDVIKKLKEGKMPLSELVINTQLRKSIDAYDLTSPELAAARKAVKEGKKKKDEMEHAVIGYIIAKRGNTISDKAVLEEFATDYDPDYYINNQVLPATMRILKELDFSEDELKGLGSQKKLM